MNVFDALLSPMLTDLSGSRRVRFTPTDSLHTRRMSTTMNDMGRRGGSNYWGSGMNPYRRRHGRLRPREIRYAEVGEFIARYPEIRLNWLSRGWQQVLWAPGEECHLCRGHRPSIWGDTNAGRCRQYGECEFRYRAEMYQAQQGLCLWCQDDLEPDLAFTHVDHIIPVSLSGPDEHWNHQLLHALCNSRKRNQVTDAARRLAAEHGIDIKSTEPPPRPVPVLSPPRPFPTEVDHGYGVVVRLEDDPAAPGRLVRWACRCGWHSPGRDLTDRIGRMVAESDALDHRSAQCPENDIEVRYRLRVERGFWGAG
jgi:5-methylcytosine-specific restriction endonuclease McrA